jgi:hypothetical protein
MLITLSGHPAVLTVNVTVVPAGMPVTEPLLTVPALAIKVAPLLKV